MKGAATVFQKLVDSPDRSGATSPSNTMGDVLVGDAIFSLSPLNSGQFFWADAKSGKTLWLSEPRQAGNAAINEYNATMKEIQEAQKAQ